MYAEVESKAMSGSAIQIKTDRSLKSRIESKIMDVSRQHNLIDIVCPHGFGCAGFSILPCSSVGRAHSGDERKTPKYCHRQGGDSFANEVAGSSPATATIHYLSLKLKAYGKESITKGFLRGPGAER